MVYRSPIQLIQEQMTIQVENDIYKAVQRVGINVDKDELKKALARNNVRYYEQSYLRGIASHIVRVTPCPVCGNKILTSRNDYPGFCSKCGQRIELAPCGAWCPGFDSDYGTCTVPNYACHRKCQTDTYTTTGELLADLNANEIIDHLKDGTLQKWLERWQEQMIFEIDNMKRKKGSE